MQEYYIQDTRNYVGNSVLWWRVDGHGYTADVRQAWRVSYEEARRIIKNRDTDVAWPCELIDAGVQYHFDAQGLRGKTPLERGMKNGARKKA